MKNTNNLNSGHFSFGIEGLFISKLNLRCYSTQNTPVVPNLVPIRTYNNSDLDKLDILKENKGKSGVYRWVNKESGKSYVGSGVDLSKRLSGYYSERSMLTQIKKGKSAIYSAILKYGRSNFSLEILEYDSIREPGVLLERETYYINLLKPKYNISLTASAPMTGRNHSEETKKRIREAGLGHIHSEETKNKMREARLGRPRPEGAGSPSVQIEV